MILPFSTQLNGKPTYFVEKILRAVINEHSHKVKGISEFIYDSGLKLNYNYAEDILSVIDHKVKPKLHTIREDKKNRWKVGTKIDFFINCRQKDMFRFAPVLPVVSIQEIEIFWYSRLRLLEPSKLNKERYNYVEISVDGRLLTIKEISELAIYDGFDSAEEFFNYFNSNFKGKLIHWTNIRY